MCEWGSGILTQSSITALCKLREFHVPRNSEIIRCFICRCALNNTLVPLPDYCIVLVLRNPIEPSSDCDILEVPLSDALESMVFFLSSFRCYNVFVLFSSSNIVVLDQNDAFCICLFSGDLQPQFF